MGLLRRLYDNFAGHFTYHLVPPPGCTECPWCGQRVGDCRGD